MARRKPPLRMHDVTDAQSLDRILLLLAFVIGVGGGILLKLWTTGPFWSAGFAAIILCAYALATYLGTHLQLEPETIGDNCYYLGFLFTLTSLSVTLYFVVEAGADRRADLIPEVISGFGVALSSTIVGVFLRVLMMQFRADIVVREKETRLELDQMARNLREEMARSTRQLKLFTIEALQHAKEREDTFRQRTDLIFDETRDQMKRFVEGMNQTLRDTAAATTAQAVAGLSDETARAAGAVRLMIYDSTKEVVEASRETFSGLTAEQGEVRQFRMRLSEELTRLAETVERTTNAMAHQTEEAADRIAAAAERIDAANRRAPEDA